MQFFARDNLSRFFSQQTHQPKWQVLDLDASAVFAKFAGGKVGFVRTKVNEERDPFGESMGVVTPLIGDVTRILAPARAWRKFGADST